MTTNKIRLATRPSPLAIWQAQYVAEKLKQQLPQHKIEIIRITSEGDRDKKTPLNKMGGKQVFVTALQQALQNYKADIAVHSIKDLAANDLPGLHLASILAREQSHDVLISKNTAKLSELPAGSLIGTSSPRRRCQLKQYYPNLIATDIRGNIATRIEKLEGPYAAIILAYAGIKRLNLEHLISEHLSLDRFIPAIGQGAIGVESRTEDKQLSKTLAAIQDPNTQLCVTAERAVNQVLKGGCNSPIAAHATYNASKDILELRAMVGSLGNSSPIFAINNAQGNKLAAQKLGEAVAEQLLHQGAAKLLQETK